MTFVGFHFSTQVDRVDSTVMAHDSTVVRHFIAKVLFLGGCEHQHPWKYNLCQYHSGFMW